MNFKNFTQLRKENRIRFVQNNLSLLVECIKGRKESYGNACLKYPELISLAREELEYSETTASCDIFYTLIRCYDELIEQKKIKKEKTKKEIGDEETAYLAGIEEGIRRAKEKNYKEVDYKNWTEL